MAESRRILVTGLSTYWGGRLAQALERNPDVEAIVGVDSEDPTRELERTEFVRVSNQHALIRRIVQAAEIDTVVDTRLVVDSADDGAAARAREQRDRARSTSWRPARGRTRRCASSSSRAPPTTTARGRDDPAFFTEDMRRDHAPRTPLKRDIVEAETAVADFRDKHPDVTVTRAALLQRARARTSTTSHARLLALPAVPMIAGFDPRYQFIHADDVVQRARVRGRERPAGHLQRRARRRAGAVRGDRPARQAGAAGAAAVGHRARRRRR